MERGRPPLVRTLDDVAALTGSTVTLDDPDEPGWEPADAVAADPARFAAQLDPASRNAPGRRAGALWMVEARAWWAAELVAGTLLEARRVPRLAPDAVAVRIGPEGQAAAVAPRSGGFHCLPDDPDRDHDDARVAVDEAALAAAARDELVAVCEPIVAAVDAAGLRRRRVAWRSVGDRVVQALGYVGDLSGRREQGWRWATAIVDAPGPLRIPFAFELREGASFAYRATCCLNYRDPAEERCVSCPVRAPRG
ncbi:(2Fe-2S)-binding protein [Patulibacter defluvii]|uniref:(2Fe-2S)-binding protein n=1 Tax=Patulibacter defluvii TaxID=3095358 RepID=UPI002A7514BA|nr:(2Fe-2S)-binding protein [Patulibacter sp. DM4]